MHAVSDEKRVVGQRTSGPPKGQGLDKHPSTCIFSDLFPGLQVANEIAKPL